MFLLLLGRFVKAEDSCETSERGFVAALRSSAWNCAKQVAESSTIAYDALSALFDSEQRAVLGEIAAVKAAIDRRQQAANIVYLAPAFQWAQSPEEIFLSVKFSHKLDAPATLNVQHNLTLGEDSLSLVGSNGVKSFRLELSLLKAIVVEESGWSSGSNGRITITLKKDKVAKWARLLKDKSKKPANMHFWVDKQEAHAEALDALPEEDTPVATKPAAEEGVAKPLPAVEEVPKPKPAPVVPVEESAEERLRREREQKLQMELEDLDKEKNLRLVEASKRAREERAAIEKDIEERKKQLQAREGSDAKSEL